MTKLRIETAEVFAPLLQPSRYKGAHGGRGSGKSYFFAGLVVERCIQIPGTSVVCIREVQKDLKDSAKRLIENLIRRHGAVTLFDIKDREIITPGDGRIIFQGMKDHTAESIKSLEDFDVAWVEEAHTLRLRSLTLLRPTIRKPGSELWFSWNRTKKTDPVDVLLTGAHPPEDTKVVQANWSDNPWFPAELEQERRNDFSNRPEMYDHTWGGDYAKIVEGAYFMNQMLSVRNQGRILRLAPDPLMTVQLFIDIGGESSKSDAFVIWVVQWVDKEVRVLDYYERKGQSFQTHLGWLKSKGYIPYPENDTQLYTEVWLPHDGEHVYRYESWEQSFREAGYLTRIIPNQGKGAAMLRVESARRLFPAVLFNDTKDVEFGISRLSEYHERIDPKHLVGLGPQHDDASHAGDAFGMMCIAYEMPDEADNDDEEVERIMASRTRSAVTGY